MLNLDKRFNVELIVILVATLGAAATAGLLVGRLPTSTSVPFLSVAALMLGSSITLLRRATVGGFAVGAYLIIVQAAGNTPGAPKQAVAVLQFALILVLGIVALPFLQQLRSRLASNVRSGTFWVGPLAILPGVLSSVTLGGLWSLLAHIVVLLVPLLSYAGFQLEPRRWLHGIAAGCGIAVGSVMLLAAFAPATIDGRLSGSIYAEMHPNVLGLFCAALAIVWLNLEQRHRAQWPVIASLAYIVVMTDSRTSMVAAATGVAFGMRTWKMRLCALLAGVAALGLGASKIFAPRSAGTDVLTGRELIWQTGLSEWKSWPLIEKLSGSATDPLGRVTLANGETFIAHNALLGALLRGGLLGLAALVIGMLILLLKLLSWEMRPSPTTAMAASLVAFGLATVWTEAFLVVGPAWWWATLGEAGSSSTTELSPSTNWSHDSIGNQPDLKVPVLPEPSLTIGSI